jgi:hypothetical protein
MAAGLGLALTGCEYNGPADTSAHTSAPAPTPPRSFAENTAEVARLLGLPASDPGMPSEAEPVGKLFLVLAPGDYQVTGACAGVYGARLTIVKADGIPEASDFECDTVLDRFFRHPGGPVTISAVPRIGGPSATGVKVQTNPDPRASALADFSEWSAKHLQPQLPGEFVGASMADTTTVGTLLAPPGKYEFRLVCDGPAGAEVSVSTAAGAEVVVPTQIPCEGQVFTAPVTLPDEGVEVSVSPAGGVAGRFAYKLVPAG